MHPVFDIDHYCNDGFVKVCKVTINSDRVIWETGWEYCDINDSVMFDCHRSWVYFIVVGNEIYKVGETGNPLGIKSLRSSQPTSGSESRFGRLRNGDGTDEYIRESLLHPVLSNQVSLWARKCEIIDHKLLVAGVPKTVTTTFHKDLEVQYLDYMYKNSGQYPKLNKGRK